MNKKEKFEYHRERLFEEIDILDSDYLRVSKTVLNRGIFEVLIRIKKYAANNPYSAFEAGIEAYCDEIHNISVRCYQVYFPLNIPDTNDCPRQFQIEGHTISHVPKTEWQDNHALKLRHKQRTHEKVENLFIKSPNQFDHEKNTIWKLKYYARESDYAIEQSYRIVDLLVAKMNLALHQGTHGGDYFGPEVFSNRESDLRSPFVCIHVTEYEVGSVHSSNPFSLRDQEHIDYSGENVKSKIESFPDLISADSGLEGRLRKALNAYQNGITSIEESDAFFDYWRALEILTITEPSDNTEVVVDRATAMVDLDHQFFDISDAVIGDFVNTRNKLVHEDEDALITERKVNYAKTILDGLINSYLAWHAQDATQQEILWDFNHYSMELDKLSSKSDRLSEIHRNRCNVMKSRRNRSYRRMIQQGANKAIRLCNYVNKR